MPSFSFPEYLAANAGRSYPISEFAGRRDISGSVALPDDLLADARVNALPVYASAGTFFVSRVELTASLAAVSLSFAPADPDAPARLIAVVSIDPRTARFGDFAAFRGEGEDASVTGTLTFGDLGSALAALSGQWEFAVDQTPLEPDAVSVGQPSVRFVELYNGGSLVGVFPDALRLVAGRNVSFTRIDETTVRMDAQDGLNVPAADECAGAVEAAPPIRTINGIPPDANGNFNLLGDECIVISPDAASVKISDACSKSCCGCDELQQLVEAQRQTETQVRAMQAQIDFVNGQVQAMLGNLAAALAY
jgi:hypothetical protein